MAKRSRMRVSLRIVEVQVRRPDVVARARSIEFTAAIAGELGLVHKQLELAIAPAANPTPLASSAIASSTSPARRRAVKCPECGRWNYHVAGCSRGKAGAP